MSMPVYKTFTVTVEGVREGVELTPYRLGKTWVWVLRQSCQNCLSPVLVENVNVKAERFPEHYPLMKYCAVKRSQEGDVLALFAVSSAEVEFGFNSQFYVDNSMALVVFDFPHKGEYAFTGEYLGRAFSWLRVADNDIIPVVSKLLEIPYLWKMLSATPSWSASLGRNFTRVWGGGLTVSHAKQILSIINSITFNEKEARDILAKANEGSISGGGYTDKSFGKRDTFYLPWPGENLPRNARNKCWYSKYSEQHGYITLLPAMKRARVRRLYNGYYTTRYYVFDGEVLHWALWENRLSAQGILAWPSEEVKYNEHFRRGWYCKGDNVEG